MISNESKAVNEDNPVLAEQISELAAVPDTLRRFVGDRSADDLRQPGQDGGHAVVEVLCQLLDWEEITGERVWKILHEESPELESFDDSLWSIEHDYLSRDALEAIEQFAVQRGKLVEMLGEITNDEMERTAQLDERGEITLGWLIEKTVKHDKTRITELGEAMS